jgi:integrase
MNETTTAGGQVLSKKSLTWERIGDNLIKYKPNGKYYVQAKLGGRRVRECLNTDNLQAARTKLASWLALHRTSGSGAGTGATMGSLLELWRAQLAADNTLAERTREYKVEVLGYVLLKTWHGFAVTKVKNIKKHDVEMWKKQQKAAATRVNGCLTILRELFSLAEARGILRGISPMRGVKNLKVGIKPFKLPTKAQMDDVRTSVYNSSPDAGLMFDLLAETGSRISTARSICWNHIDWPRNVIYYKKVKWKKGGYEGPMSKRLREVLEKAKPETAVGPIVPIKKIRRPLLTACKHLNIPPISHHDLRHWFVTRAIEKGVDIPTISRWIGHVDGGALLMQTYGHYRDEHSQEMAKRL